MGATRPGPFLGSLSMAENLGFVASSWQTQRGSGWWCYLAGLAVHTRSNLCPFHSLGEHFLMAGHMAVHLHPCPGGSFPKQFWASSRLFPRPWLRTEVLQGRPPAVCGFPVDPMCPQCPCMAASWLSGSGRNAAYTLARRRVSGAGWRRIHQPSACWASRAGHRH